MEPDDVLEILDIEWENLELEDKKKFLKSLNIKSLT